ncbi:MAG: hypothetical protein AcusKO_10990 [Acuticoccus sp.]
MLLPSQLYPLVKPPESIGPHDRNRGENRADREYLTDIGLGFVERFNGTVLDEFFRITMRETFYATVDALQSDLDAWLVHYNTERPHLGYRNQGRRPIQTLNSFVSQDA